MDNTYSDNDGLAKNIEISGVNSPQMATYAQIINPSCGLGPNFPDLFTAHYSFFPVR